MYAITSQTPNGQKGGAWRVLPGDDHTPMRGDNLNRFFDTKRAANARVRDLNN